MVPRGTWIWVLAFLPLVGLLLSACGDFGAPEPGSRPAPDLGAIVDERVQSLIKDDIALLRAVAREGAAKTAPPASPSLSLAEAVQGLARSAQEPEWDNLQASIDAYMVANYYTTLPAGEELDRARDTSTNDFSALTGTLDLESGSSGGGALVRDTTTRFFYCWDTTGLILLQDSEATLDCTR